MSILNKIAMAPAILRGVVREHVKKITRSSHWAKARADFLLTSPQCAACHSTKLLQVHHCKPFHLQPELELDPTNLITLCQWNLCHLEIGHGNNYQYINPNVRKDALELLADPTKRTAVTIRAMQNRM